MISPRIEKHVDLLVSRYPKLEAARQQIISAIPIHLSVLAFILGKAPFKPQRFLSV